MKKFRIKDEDGMEYQVEEIEKTIPTDDDMSTLSDEEISALKKLAAVADKLVALTETTDEVEEEVKKSVNEVLEDEDEEIEEKEDKEEIVDTDEDDNEKGSMHDSINSLEKSSVNDSIDVQTDIANAWAKRYMGGNR